MGNVSSTILALLLLQVFAAAGWALAARHLGLSRREAAHWSGFSLLMAAVLGLTLARGSAPDWLTYEVCSLLAVLALLALRRGMLLFLQTPSADGEAALLLAMMAGLSTFVAYLSGDQAMAARIVLNSGTMLWVLVRAAQLSWPALRREFGHRTAYFIIVPLLAGASMFGARLVALAWMPAQSVRVLPTDSPFNTAMVMLFLLLGVLLHGSLASVVLLRLVHRLRRLSQRDALTGLLNRGEWLRRLAAQHRWLGRFGEPFAVLMIDIDHFKAVNDSLGHAAGDAALVALAQILTASAREMDVVGRLGGEEFCVLLPRTDPESARRTAERLRQAIADTEVGWNQQAIRMTVSIGVAIADDAQEPAQALLDRADRALYQAKRSGRNRTSMSAGDGTTVPS